MPISKEMLEYARGYPILLEHLFARETDKLRRSPEVQQWFAANMPNATPQERDRRIQQQAAMNAQQQGKAAFDSAKKKYGAQSFTQQDFHEAIVRDRNERADKITQDPRVIDAAAKAGSVADNYRSEVVPRDIDREYGGLSPYLPFDEPPEQPKAKPGVTPQSARAPEGEQSRPRQGAPADPVLIGVTDLMRETAKNIR